MRARGSASAVPSSPFCIPAPRAACSLKSSSLRKDTEMADRPQKINIGFVGGPVLSARVSPDELSKLRSGLGEDRWHELVAEDGTVALNLAQIVYVLVDTEGHRVGFGS